jgi:pimeloyl-ACP methyl ester carboxylesterase
LTLIEPAPFHLLRGGQASDLKLFDELGGLTEWMAASVLADTPTAGMRAYVDYWHGNSAWHRISEHQRETLTRQTARVAIDLGASLANSWSTTHCNALNCPTLVVMLLDSPGASLRTAEIVAEAIPNAHLAMIPDAGYMASSASRRMVDRLITAHLTSVDRPGSAPSAWRRAA